MYRRRMEEAVLSVGCGGGSGGLVAPLPLPLPLLPRLARGLGALLPCCCMVLSRERCAAESKGREREPMAW